jgi:hypothetical protein
MPLLPFSKLNINPRLLLHFSYQPNLPTGAIASIINVSFSACDFNRRQSKQPARDDL